MIGGYTPWLHGSLMELDTTSCRSHYLESGIRCVISIYCYHCFEIVSSHVISSSSQAQEYWSFQGIIYMYAVESCFFLYMILYKLMITGTGLSPVLCFNSNLEFGVPVDQNCNGARRVFTVYCVNDSTILVTVLLDFKLPIQLHTNLIWYLANIFYHIRI